MVVDCGGGTVDITVHEMDAKTGRLNELHKATGGPHGSTGIRAHLLCSLDRATKLRRPCLCFFFSTFKHLNTSVWNKNNVFRTRPVPQLASQNLDFVVQGCLLCGKTLE